MFKLSIKSIVTFRTITKTYALQSWLCDTSPDFENICQIVKTENPKMGQKAIRAFVYNYIYAEYAVRHAEHSAKLLVA